MYLPFHLCSYKKRAKRVFSREIIKEIEVGVEKMSVFRRKLFDSLSLRFYKLDKNTFNIKIL